MPSKDLITKSFTYDGKRYYVRGKTEKEAYIKLANKKRDLEENIVVSSTMRVDAWAYKAVDAYKLNQKEITKEKYLQRMRHSILEHIGSKRLCDVLPIDCQQILNMQQGKSKTQVNEVYQTLRFIFGRAVDNGLLNKDITAALVRPKGYTKKRRKITEEERRAVYAVAEKDKRFNMFLFMLLCGLRPSEAQHLTAEDIQVINGVPLLHVNGTKTANAVRYVPLNTFLYEQYKNASSALFTTSTGRLYTGDNYKRLCKAWYRALDIELGAVVYRNEIIQSKLAEDFCPYLLRHTFCCDCCKKGVDIRITARLMGHSSITITNEIYTHVELEDIIDAAAFF